MYHFCTYFDSGYLVRGLALYQSLREHAGEFRLYVLCFDDQVHDFLSRQRYPEVVPISLATLEQKDGELAGCKSNRSRVEYFFTCTPVLPLYILENFPGVEMVTYLDADLYFFSSPAPIFEELGSDSILIIGHRFSARHRYRENLGRYNVGFLSFRNDEHGRSCLAWWRERCIEWCYDKVEEGRFADQKYLDSWPQLFPGVCDLQHRGANLAPWNIDSITVRKKGGDLFVEGDRLVFYHFHGFDRLSPVIYKAGTKHYVAVLQREVVTEVYGRYIDATRRITAQVKGAMGHNRYHNGRRSLLDLILLFDAEEILCCVPGLPAFSASTPLRPLFAALKALKAGCLKLLGRRP